MPAFGLPPLQPWHGLTLLHVAAVACGLLSYIGLTHSGRQRRPPSAAVAWVLALVAFPYLALPVYLLLGTRKLAHARLALSASPETEVGVEPCARGLDLPPPRHCAAIDIHGEGDLALRALLARLEQAQQAIDVEMFLLRPDAVGGQVLAALERARARGVAVRVLLDGLGSLAGQRRVRRRLRAAGADFRWFSPVRLRLRPQFGRENLRNHRKRILIDGRWLWSGGRNLAAEYFLDAQGAPAWCDLSFLIDGGIALDAAEGFERDWALAGGAPAPRSASIPACTEGPRAQLLPSGPERHEDTAYALYLNAIHRADARILLASPYFVPDDALQLALVLAARRGVEVQLLLPVRSNHRMADIARERSLRELASAGVQVLLFPQMLHAKLVIVDGRLASCGSINLDGRSLFLNYELNALFLESAQIAWFEDWFVRQRALASPFVVQDPGWLRDVGEGLVRAVGFQL